MNLARYRPQALFFARLIGLYAAWFLLYEAWLLPEGGLDTWVSFSVVQVAETLLDGLGLSATAEGRMVRTAGLPGLWIANGCNGLSTLGLFAGFVLAYPGRWSRRLWFVPLGLVVVYAANVARVVGLVLLQGAWPAGFAFVHGLGATTLFYAVVFGLWVAWTHLGGAEAEAKGGAPLQTAALPGSG